MPRFRDDVLFVASSSDWKALNFVPHYLQFTLAIEQITTRARFVVLDIRMCNGANASHGVMMICISCHKECASCYH